MGVPGACSQAPSVHEVTGRRKRFLERDWRGRSGRGKHCGHRGWKMAAPVPLGASGIDGDHLPAAAPHQENPVETLSQDLKKFHIVFITLSAAGRPGHVEEDQLGIL